MRILVVGAGYWGPNIIRNLVDLPDVEAIGVSDIDPKKVEKMVRRFPRTHAAAQVPQAFSQGYQAVIIVTPVTTHAVLAKTALEHGLHVFVEKPLTQNSVEARALIETARLAGRQLMVGHVFHYKPEVRRLVEIVQSGELGKICYIDSARVNLGLFRSDVSAMWDLAPHDLSIFEALLERLPLRVSAIGATHVAHPVSPQYTMVHLHLDYGEGCLAHVHVNWFSPVKRRFMMIAGDKKMVTYDDLDVSDPIRVYDRGTYDPEFDTPAYPRLRMGELRIPSIQQEEPLAIELKEFLSAIREMRAPLTDGHAGLRVVRILEAADISLKQGSRFVDLI